MTQHVNGFDITLNARPTAGFFFRGGTSTQRSSRNDCSLRDQVPEAIAAIPSALADIETDPLSVTYCDVTGKFRTQFKALASYTIPRIDVMVSGTYQSLAGPQLLAEFVASNAVVRPSLGRNLAGGASNTPVQLVEPGTLYGPRLNQLDFRVGKVLRFGGTRATVSLDVFNVFNENTVVEFSNQFSNWLEPQGIMRPRFAKVVAQFDF
jgi:hypothetical protein